MGTARQPVRGVKRGERVPQVAGCIALFALQGCSGGDGRAASAATTPAPTVSVALSQTASVSGPSASSASPATPSVPNVVAGVALGCDQCTCAWTTWGEVYCWGNNEFGMLGDGMTTDQHRPVRVQLPDKAIQVASGAYYSCALLETGEVWCWGSYDKGAIPGGSRSGSPTKPVKIHDLEKIQIIDVANSSGIAVDREGLAVGWGLECPGGTCRVVLKRRPELDHSLLIHEELLVGCSTTQAHDVDCWTSLQDRALQTAAHSPPGIRMHMPRARSMSVSFHTACFAVEGGDAYCWGQAADGYSVWSTPTRLDNFSNVKELSIYFQSMCAVHEDGTVSCWGLTKNGPVEDNATWLRLKPEIVPNLKNVNSIVTRGHTCAITDGGELFCWGPNERGQLGDGTTTSRLEPIRVVLGERD
ncbi:MAG: hypothetical protein U0271_34410 [Polyangiaceae bacterium]